MRGCVFPKENKAYVDNCLKTAIKKIKDNSIPPTRDGCWCNGCLFQHCWADRIQRYCYVMGRDIDPYKEPIPPCNLHDLTKFVLEII